MGQFKPMVKMMTTEPTVELKLKKGGAVKKADGGYMAMPSTDIPAGMPARGGMAPAARPAKPSMAARRAAMAGARKRPMAPPMSTMPVMKKGGKAEMETPAMHKAEMSEIGKVGKELKSHAGKPASKAHKGLKTGGVVDGQGGYKKGGAVAKNGIINTENQGGEYRNTKVVTAKPDTSPAKTGDVKMGNSGGYATGGVVKGQGGYKKGGAAKKFAKGGAVQDDGKAVKMPQGQKRTPSPVSINRLSGTYKKGGSVKKMNGGGATSDSDVAYFDKNKVDPKAVSDKASRELEDALNPFGMVKELYGKARDAIIQKMPDKSDYKDIKREDAMQKMPEKSDYKDMKRSDALQNMRGQGAVTKTEKSITVSPVARKRGGSVKC